MCPLPGGYVTPAKEQSSLILSLPRSPRADILEAASVSSAIGVRSGHRRCVYYLLQAMPSAVEEEAQNQRTQGTEP